MRARRRGQNVVDVRAAHERRRDIALAPRRDEPKPRALHRELYVARRDLRALVQSVTEDATAFARNLFGETRAVLVVHVDDRSARAFAEAPVEESPLGGEVVLHRAVIVEVVARQVREGRDLVAQRITATKVERLRRRLHHGHAAAALDGATQKSLDIARLRRRVQSFGALARDAVFDRADEGRPLASGFSNRRDEIRARRLPVRARDADKF